MSQRWPEPRCARLAAATVTVQPPKWLSSTDHKIIGQLYLIGGLLGLLATIAINVLIGLERIDSDSVTFDDVLAQLFDAQHVGLVFGAGIPLALALCVAIVPLQLGCRSVAFPRLAALGFWLWFGGLILNVVSLIANGGTSATAATWSTCSSPASPSWHSVSRQRRSDRHLGAHHPGPASRCGGFRSSRGRR